jgi:hypothetical protein
MPRLGKIVLGFSVFTLLFSTGSLRSLGQELPPLEITIYDSAATEGYYFMCPYRTMPPYQYYHPQLILDSLGRTVFYRVFSGLPIGNSNTLDFKIQPNGQITYYSYALDRFLSMDSTFTEVDTFNVANNFQMDVHDIQFLPDGHYLLLAKESRYMNLSAYHWFGANHNQPGGTNAEVIGAVIQEFDENENLVWEWKAHDHFDFDDVDSIWLFGPNKVDWTHANAIERDADGNMLLSSRHFNEITKINRQNGNIIWRLGGKENQFTFVNDPIRFKGQHDIRRLPNGHITLYDNGRYHIPEMARALEYSLIESSKIATLQWEYIYDSTMYSIALGNFQTLENGNRLVDFGNISGDFPWLVLVKPDKSKILEIVSPEGHVSYRAFNYKTLPWNFPRPQVECHQSGTHFTLEAESGHPEYLWSTGATTQSIPVNDTGTYWVFVPLGEGYICSKFIRITSMVNPCLFPGQDELVPPGASLECIPNPVTAGSRLVFRLSEAADVRLILHDFSGRTIFTWPVATWSAGKHAIPFPAGNLHRGLYLLSLQTGREMIIQKVTVP